MGKWTTRTKRWAKRKAKSAWTTHRKNARAREKERSKAAEHWEREARKQTAAEKAARQRRKTAAEAEHRALVRERVGEDNGRGSFLARHPHLADVRDWISAKGHEFLDVRELRSGLITQAELEAFADYDSPEEWREAMRERRREQIKRSRVDNRAREYGPLTLVYGSAGSTVGRVEVKGFQPPPPRATRLKPVPTEKFAAPQPRPLPKRKRARSRHVEAVAAAWAPQMDKRGSTVVAGDASLSSVVQGLQTFAEEFPERRSEVADKMAALQQLGDAFASSMEELVETLRRGRGEDNPGFPPEVLQFMAPLIEVGQTIRKAGAETHAAWESYFQKAIEAAKDEHTPSKQALTS